MILRRSSHTWHTRRGEWSRQPNIRLQRPALRVAAEPPPRRALRLHSRYLPFLAAAFGLLAAASASARSISEAELLAYASTPYDSVENKKIALGGLDGTQVVADFICSDICPDYTVRVIHYELRADQTCSSVGGVEKALSIPVGIAATDRVFCFPKVLVDNWHKYQRKISSVPSGVGPHD